MKRREESRESNQEERRLMGLHRNMLIKQYDKVNLKKSKNQIIQN